MNVAGEGRFSESWDFFPRDPGEEPCDSWDGIDESFGESSRRGSIGLLESDASVDPDPAGVNPAARWGDSRGICAKALPGAKSPAAMRHLTSRTGENSFGTLVSTGRLHGGCPCDEMIGGANRP